MSAKRRLVSVLDRMRLRIGCACYCCWIVFVLIGVNLASAMQGRANESSFVTIYVSPLGDDGFSGRFPDRRLSEREGPVKTIERAQNMLREYREQEKAGIGYRYKVVFRAGTYELRRALILTSFDSGRNGNPIVYASYPGELARISGGRTLVGWTKQSDSSWKTSYASIGDRCPSQLYINGVRRSRPRYPTEGTLRIAEVIASHSGQERDVFKIRMSPSNNNSEVLQFGNNLEIVILDGWVVSRLRVIEIDHRTGLVTFKGKFSGRGQRKELVKDLPYYFDNVDSGVLSAERWICNSESREVSFLPPINVDMSTAISVVPLLEQLVVLRGTASSPVHNIVFEGIIFEYASWSTPQFGWSSPQAAIGLPSAIEISHANKIDLRNIAVIHTGANAIGARVDVSNVKIESAEIRDIGGVGVAIGLEQSTPKPGSFWNARAYSKFRVHDIKVRNSLIASTGRIHFDAPGIWIGQADNITVAKNEIRDLYYTGISVGWTWWYQPSLSYNNTISGNLIHKYGQGALSDLGGIYTVGPQPGTIISDNIILDGEAREYGGHGLYADAGSSGILFRKNLISRVSHAGIHIQNGRYDSFTENALSDFGEAGILCRGGADDSSILFANNIIISSGAPVVSGFCGDVSFSFLNNTFWDKTGLPKMWSQRWPREVEMRLPKSLVENNEVREVQLELGRFKKETDSGVDYLVTLSNWSNPLLTRDMIDGPSTRP